MSRLRGYGSPVVVSDRPVLGSCYGLHWAHAPKGGGPRRRDETSWRTISGVVVNTRWGAVWLFFRRWSA